MSDNQDARDAESDEQPPMEAARYPDGTILYPVHPLGPDGQKPVEMVDLSAYRDRRDVDNLDGDTTGCP